VPFKLNQDRRHHIPKQKHKVTNWREYDAVLRQRGSHTVWFTDEAIAAWWAEPRATRGGQASYSPLAQGSRMKSLRKLSPFPGAHPVQQDRAEAHMGALTTLIYRTRRSTSPGATVNV
jgi:hypothetical protein